ncbi:activity regulator of membrane protease YbbK [Enterovibrio sp. ZSDZ35]|uniref:Activity regulator of membrane protease YbbK n=1 Tax=Enterovibrio qingdaonensis TaxID=2899818 RepID=A0ABT5QQF9_9GAMM|nr:NfeD family protein [Enterovibrio sp. ZSDZ35]MDD1783212.1 activity regulator of membrane protease YbbK [Enterovibrio sp. ZSDZ35]
MNVLDYFQSNLAEATIIVGMILLIVEIWLFGLSTIILLALGIAAIITGGLVWFGVLSETMTTVITGSGVGAGVLTLILWGPMKRAQVITKRDYNIHSDLMGLEFTLESTLDIQTPTIVRYSGVSWKLVLSNKCRDAVLEPGSTVKVVGVDVGKFFVEPKPQDSAAETAK